MEIRDTTQCSCQVQVHSVLYPDVACWSISGQDCLRRQNENGCLVMPAEPVVACCCWLDFLKDPSRRGGLDPGGSTRPGGGGHSRVRRRADSERLWGGVTVPGGGTTLGKPCSPLGPVCIAGLTITLPADALLPLVTVPLVLPVGPGVNGGWLPLPSVLPSPEESRLREKRFGLRLRLATLLVTYCCKELKKLILSKCNAVNVTVKKTFSGSLACSLRNRPRCGHPYFPNKVHYFRISFISALYFTDLSDNCFSIVIYFCLQRSAQQSIEDSDRNLTIDNVQFCITSVNRLSDTGRIKLYLPVRHICSLQPLAVTSVSLCPLLWLP
jgi:hypothetical protein